MKLVALALVGMSALLAGVLDGSVTQIFTNDRSGLTFVILGLTFIGTALWWWAGRIGAICFRLGLTGTVIGFIIAFSGVDPQAALDASQTQRMISSLIDGMGTALGTTLCGIIATIWLTVVRWTAELDNVR